MLKGTAAGTVELCVFIVVYLRAWWNPESAEATVLLFAQTLKIKTSLILSWRAETEKQS